MLWLWDPVGGDTKLVREGDPAPGTVGATFNRPGDTWFVNVSASAFNNSGVALLSADLLNGDVVTGINDRGLFLLSKAGNSLAMRRGDPVPGVAGATFDVVNNSSAKLNNNGEFCFQSTIVGGGSSSTDDTGIWFGSPGSLQLVAREGDPAVGMGGGELYGNFTGLSILLNDQGQVLFNASIVGGAGGTNLYIWDAGAGVRLVVADNEMITGPARTVTKQVGSFGGVQFGNGSGRSLSFGNDGKIALDLNMTDSTGAIAIVDVVPQPFAYCTAKTNSLGCVPSIASTGTASATTGSGLNGHDRATSATSRRASTSTSSAAAQASVPVPVRHAVRRSVGHPPDAGAELGRQPAARQRLLGRVLDRLQRVHADEAGAAGAGGDLPRPDVGPRPGLRGALQHDALRRPRGRAGTLTSDRSAPRASRGGGDRRVAAPPFLRIGTPWCGTGRELESASGSSRPRVGPDTRVLGGKIFPPHPCSTRSCSPASSERPPGAPLETSLEPLGADAGAGGRRPRAPGAHRLRRAHLGAAPGRPQRDAPHAGAPVPRSARAGPRHDRAGARARPSRAATRAAPSTAGPWRCMVLDGARGRLDRSAAARGAAGRPHLRPWSSSAASSRARTSRALRVDRLGSEPWPALSAPRTSGIARRLGAPGQKSLVHAPVVTPDDRGRTSRRRGPPPLEKQPLPPL